MSSIIVVILIIWEIIAPQIIVIKELTKDVSLRLTLDAYTMFSFALFSFCCMHIH